MRNIPQRFLSLLLSLAMTAALLPAPALAEERGSDTSAVQTEQSAPVEEEGSDVEPEPDAAAEDASALLWETGDTALSDEEQKEGETSDTAETESTEDDADTAETEQGNDADASQDAAAGAEEQPQELPAAMGEAESAPAHRESVDSAAEVARLIGESWDEGFFQEAVVDPKKDRVTVDGSRSSVTDAFGEEAAEAEILDSAQAAEAYFEDTPYEAEVQRDGTVTVTAPWQTCRIVVTADTLPEDYGAETILEYREYHQFVLQFATQEATQAAYEQLSEEYDCYVDQVFTAEDSLLEEGGTVSGSQTLNWGAAYMGMEGLRTDNPFDSSAHATVAIIDTGCQVGNDLFAGRSFSSASRNLQDGSNDISDVKGHGTHVAGIIATCTPDNVELLVLRVYDQSGNATLLTVDVALKYALEQEADVVNISLGQTASSGASNNHTLDASLAAVKAAGIPVVCAAGNVSKDVASTYPASSADTIAVSALNSSGSFAATFEEEPDTSVLGTGATGSSYGEGIDFCAPGVNITSAWKQGTNTQSGTSMAAPHIAAALAWLRLSDPTASVEELYESLKAMCTDLGEPGKDIYYGWGCPNLSSLAENACAHRWTAQVVQPTCTARGYTEYTCELCGESYRRSYTAMIAHQLEVDASGSAVCASCGQTGKVSFDDGLRWDYDASTETLTITGSGEIQTKPWEVFYAPERIKKLLLSGVTGIGDGLFCAYPALQRVEPGAALERLGENVFYGCTALQSIPLPASLTSIGDGALSGCTALEAFSLDEGNTAFSVSSTGFLYNADGTELLSCAAGYTSAGSDYRYFIPARVKTVHGRAFDGCIHVVTVVLPTGLQEVGSEAFARCASLKNVYVKCDQPRLGNDLFTDVTASIYVSQGLKGWDSSLSAQLGGALSWKSYVGNLEDWVMTLNATEWGYTGNGRRPGIILTCGDTVARNYDVKDAAGHVTKAANYSDYFTYSYANNTEPGVNTATATATGTRLYYGTQTVNFSVLLDTPSLTGLSTSTAGVTIRWEAVEHAVKYRVLRRIGSGSWEQVGDSAGTALTDKNAVSGEKIAYTVCCIGSNGGYTSRYSSTGLAINYVAAPVLRKVEEVSSGIRISWGKVKGAVGYRVFRKTGSGKWKQVGDTTGTALTDKKAVSGAKNTYTVRCIDEDGVYTSAYNTTGMSMDYVAAPVLGKVHNANGGVRISWGKVKGASKYQVLCKIGTGKWKKVGTTTSASLLAKTSDGRTGLKAGKKYTFTVVCLSADGKGYASLYDTTGKSVVYVPAPALSSLKNLKGKKLRVRWKKIAGASGYQIQYARNRKMRKGRIARTSAGKKVLSHLKKKKKYYVRVRAYKIVSGKKYYSAWSGVKGVRIKK